MTPIAILEHEIPRRLRLRIPERRGDASFFQWVVEALSQHSEIEEIVANPLTGSLLVHHSGSAQAILAAATEQRLFEVGRTNRRKANSTTPRTKPTPLDPVATGLSGLALFQVARGQVAGSAAENFWNAYGAQRILGRPEIVAGFALLGIVQVLRGRLFSSAASLLFYSLVMRQLASADRAATASRDSAAAPRNAQEGLPA